jgi:hypothetical protein
MLGFWYLQKWKYVGPLLCECLIHASDVLVEAPHPDWIPQCGLVSRHAQIYFQSNVHSRCENKTSMNMSKVEPVNNDKIGTIMRVDISLRSSSTFFFQLIGTRNMRQTNTFIVVSVSNPKNRSCEALPSTDPSASLVYPNQLRCQVFHFLTPLCLGDSV